MNKCFKTSDYHHTCKACNRKTLMSYLIQMADRKRQKEIKCICGAEIGTLNN